MYIGFNIKFDIHWLSSRCHSAARIWDCQLAEHIYTGQRGQYVSLNECLEKYGLETKKDLVKELWEAGVGTEDISVPVLQEYNEWDVIQTEKLFLIQQELLDEAQKNLVYLLGEDLKVLASTERNGLLFDRVNAESKLKEYVENVGVLERQLNEFLPVISHGQFNWDSGDHLSCLLYGGTLGFDWFIENEAVYKSGVRKGEAYIKRSWQTESVAFEGLFKPLEGTEVAKTKDKPDAVTRFYQTDGPTLSSLKGGGKAGRQLIEYLQQRSATQKIVEMLQSLFKIFNDKGWEHNLIHGQYNQNVAITGRLSSSAPNMQNSPPEIDQFFVSRYD